MSIPSIGDLLDPRKAGLDPEFRVKATDNALLPTIEGIGAIGFLMSARDKSSGLAEEALVDTGYLLIFLGELASNLLQIKNAAVYEQVNGHAMEVVS